MAFRTAPLSSGQIVPRVAIARVTPFIRRERPNQLRGLVKLKISKNPRIIRIGQTPPTHTPIQFFFGNMKTSPMAKSFSATRNSSVDTFQDNPRTFKTSVQEILSLKDCNRALANDPLLHHLVKGNPAVFNMSRASTPLK